MTPRGPAPPVVRVVACFAIISVALSACVTRTLPTDELGIRSRADREEAVLLKRVTLYQDPGVVGYVSEVVGRLRPGGPGTVGTVKVGVIEDPTIGAFVLPNGHLFIHTGLLSVLSSEAQLAAIVARELARYDDRDASGGTPRAGRGTMVHATLSPTAAAILGRDLSLAAAAAIVGYGAERERAADAEGSKRLAAAGYDPREAGSVFQLLARGGADRGPLEIFFYGNRPLMGERYESILELLPPSDATTGGTPDPTRGGEAEFERRMRLVVRDNAALDVRAGRFELARRQLDRVLSATPDDPTAQLHYGDLCRLLSQRTDNASKRTDYTRKAMERYERAIALDPKYAEPFRQVGLLYYEGKDMTQARRAFEMYLALAPGAADAQRIREYLAALRD